MKKVVILGILMFYFSSFSQSITVNTTSYTASELVNQILINSPCVNATNINSKSGTQFGSTNSIGYFENTNTNFPFTSGVVLSTGDVTKVPAPNDRILSDGSNSWTGDTDLENNLLSQSGITINSINATYIEFDFQPKTPNFDFSFLFASEEYGTFQCNFSDAFAFLLKDVTAGGSNRNLAVIPNTNIPVSVETIRDNTYNSNCPSTNPNYFGAYNFNGFGPAINFNGQTVKMTASASGLDITHTYRIKLVIADGDRNVEYDSAIFLEANSFNIGQNVLGLNYTAANNKAICPSTILPTLNATGLSTGTTFVWKKGDLPFSPAQTATTLDLNTLLPLISSGIHNYSVSYIEPGCAEVTDEIIIEIYPEIRVIPIVPPIYVCNTGAATYNFDLTKNTTITLTGNNPALSPAENLYALPSTTNITYHLSNINAVKGEAAISSLHTIMSSESGKVIYARIESTISPCYEIRSFRLLIVAAPMIANALSGIVRCAIKTRDETPKATFNLAPSINTILGAQDPNYNILTFHSTLNGANDNTDVVVPNSSNRVLSSGGTLWVRLQNISNPECYITTSFQLIVTPVPQVDFLEDVFVCTSYSLPILTKTGAQYWTETSGTGTHLAEGSSVTETSTLYIFNQSGLCTNQSSFTINIVNDLNTITPVSSSYCSAYELPALPYGRYFTQSGGTNTLGNTELAAETSIKTAGINTIYVWFEDTTVTPTCTREKFFTITIIPFSPLPKYTNQFSCTSYTLPTNSNGGVYYSNPNKGLPIIPPGTSITATKSIYVFKETGTSAENCSSEQTFIVYVDLASISPPSDVNSCSAYTLPALIVGEYRTAPSGGGLLVPEKTSINTTTTLWYYVPGQSCTDYLQFTITVNIAPLPKFEDTAPQCGVYYLNPVAHTGDYFTGPLGTGKKRPVGYPITTTQTMYFYDKASTGPCYVEKEFLITIYPYQAIDARPVEVIQCRQAYVLDDLSNGEYYEFPGGPTATNLALPPGYKVTSSKIIYVHAAASSPNTCDSEYSISVIVTMVNAIEDQYACNLYELPAIIGLGDYYTAAGGPNGIGIKLSLPYFISTTTSLYVYTEDNSRVFCFDEDEFKVTIYNRPVVMPYLPITRCESYTLPPLIAPVNKYFSKAGGPSANNTEKFPGDLITSSTTIYAYSEVGTASTTLCFEDKPIAITITSKPEPVLSITPICHDFKTGILTNSYVVSDYRAPRYSFEWKKEDGTLVSSSWDFSTNQLGNYSLTVTDLSISGCSSDPVAFTVEEIFPPTSITYTTEGWFTDSQTIIINAIPANGDKNNFLYTLDENLPQTSNIFRNVASGTHEMSISDAYGCGSTIPIIIQLINSPKYFTPNGDSFNDTWNIIDMPNQDDPKLYVFDRYGKLLKQLYPNGSGWDGTYNGQPMPADDYWFYISYLEKGILKEYRSHFSLKR